MKETEGHAEAVKQPLVEAVAQIDERALAEELPLGVPLGLSEMLTKGLLVPLQLPVGVVHVVAEAVTQCEGEALPDALLQGEGESEAAAEEDGCDAEALALPEMESEGVSVAVPHCVAVPLDVGALVGEGSDEKEARDEVDADGEGDPVVDTDGLPDWDVVEPLAAAVRVTEKLGVLHGVGAGVELSRADAETLLLDTSVLLAKGLGDARPLAVTETHPLAEDAGVTVDCPVTLPLKEGGAVAVRCPDKVEAAEGAGEYVAGGEGDAHALKFPDDVEVPDEDAGAEALALHVDISVPTELTDTDGDAVEDADEVLQSVGSEVPLEVAEAVTLEVGAGVAVPAPVEDPLLERDVFDVPVEEAEGVNEAIAVAVAVPEKLRTAVNEPVPVKDAEGEAVALVEADAVGETLEVQRSCAGSHALLTAQAGAPSSRVHAGPSATPSGHQEPPEPHPCGATTARNEAGAKVNTDEAAHAAEETPWQVSDGASHWRPSSHSVAERGPS